MNGRKIFQKYNKLIYLIVELEKKLPKRFRKNQLARLRNKDGKLAMFKRYVLLKTLAKSVGDNVSIFPGVFFENIENLTIGNNVSIHQMCYIDAEGGIEIGDNVSIAHKSTILSSNHSYKDMVVPIKYQDMILQKTVLHNNIWIGCGCVILAGVNIQSGCVIGAASIVTHNIEKNSVVVGNPAQIIKKRM
ncbi:MAG: acyltransferase [Clostridium sp.]|nr:acyltransferase [Clostridium sp.]MCM1209564.1 acyltransferase [Ruminococcus sp.]MCM1287563.1 acyltransferase [Clostridium sp.]